MRTVRVSAAILIAAGAAGIAWAITQLADGFQELPRHWWSSIPAVLIAIGVALAVIGSVASRLGANRTAPRP